MQKLPIEAAKNVDEYDGEIFQSEEEMQRSIRTLCHGDFYVIGKLWIRALRTVLVGANLSLIPVVKAKPPEAPEKPPPMKYTDLPIYQSPHFEYKDYVEGQQKCPKADVKIVHAYLYPTVRSYRKHFSNEYAEFKKDIGELKADAGKVIKQKKEEFKTYMRSPDNLELRQAVVAFGTVTGYYLGSGGSIPKRIFYSGLGALTAGALTFPKETDEIFRNVSYQIGKFAIGLYNKTCNKNFTLRERLPCRDDMPPPPAPRDQKQVNKCDFKTKK